MDPYYEPQLTLWKYCTRPKGLAYEYPWNFYIFKKRRPITSLTANIPSSLLQPLTSQHKITQLDHSSTQGWSPPALQYKWTQSAAPSYDKSSAYTSTKLINYSKRLLFKLIYSAQIHYLNSFSFIFPLTLSIDGTAALLKHPENFRKTTLHAKRSTGLQGQTQTVQN